MATINLFDEPAELTPEFKVIFTYNEANGPIGDKAIYTYWLSPEELQRVMAYLQSVSNVDPKFRNKEKK